MVRRGVAEHAGVYSVATAGCVADQVALAGRIELCAWHNPLPDPALDSTQKFLWRCVSHQRALRDQSNVGGGRFDVGNDMGREDDDALAGKLREQVAEPDTFFGIESGSWLVERSEERRVGKE